MDLCKVNFSISKLLIHCNTGSCFPHMTGVAKNIYMFRQACNCCKRVLEAAKPSYATKTKESITFQKLDFQAFWQIANSVLNEGISAIPPLFKGLEVLPSGSDKAKLFAKNFSYNSNIDDLSIPCFPF